MISRFQINGFRRLFFVNSPYRISTVVATPPNPPQNHFLFNYLVNSLGLSENEAVSVTKKVTLYKTSRNDPDLVVNFLRDLGLNRNQIIKIVSANPKLLTSNVDKTLRPKILCLQELGILGADLVKVITGYNFILGRGQLTSPIEYLRNLLGSYEDAVKAIKRCSSVLDTSASRVIDLNVQLLLKHGISKERVSRFVVQNPRVFIYKPKRLEQILYMVENEFGISPRCEMFYHGVLAASTISKATIESKVSVLRSFGYSDSVIYLMIKKFPGILRRSEDKLRKAWDFFTKEIGCSPDFLRSHPTLFNHSLEKRVIPRSEVLKILKEKNLSNRKLGLYRLMSISESDFLDDFIFPYKNQIPDVVDSYLTIVGRKKN